MRKYFYCDANCKVYTEKEKGLSRYPASRFSHIGEFKSRSDAEIYYIEKYPFADIVTSPDKTE